MKDESGQNGSALLSGFILHPSSFILRPCQEGPHVRDNSRSRERIDRARIEAAVREILFAVGEDPDREGLKETPARVARAYAELFSGLHVDPRIHLRKTFTEKYDEV